MRYWIQRADFTTSDHEAIGAPELEQVFGSHPWQRELELQTSLEQQEQESCDPGLGIVPGDGRILHLCPQRNAMIRCHYHFIENRSVAGLFRIKRPKVITAEISIKQATELIRYFTANGHSDLLRQLGIYGST